MLLARIGCCLMLALAASFTLADELPKAFNGRDLTGWTVPADNIWWHVHEGVLQVRSGPNHQPSTLWTEQEFGDFVMQFEFKMGEGTIDTGVFVRTETDQIQIGESGSLKRDMTGSPYINGKGYPVEATGVAELLKPDDWNEMTIVAIGANYVVWLNGKQVVSYESDTAVDKGPIGIQLHAQRDMAVDYRNIAIAALK